MRRRGLWATAALALALALAGCGSSGGDGGNSASQPSSSATEKAPRVIVETAEHGFDAAKVYREASPGVVTIRSIFGNGGGAAEGSGFVLDTSGRIVTNAHVVTDESSGTRKPAKEVFIEFPDRNVVPAKIVGFDPFADVALLEVKPDGFALHPLQLGNDHDLVVGQPVAAIGSPFGEQQSLSVGVVSATDRSVESLTKFQIEGAIQTDASINPGNSGGPLLDAGARVLGINEQIETDSGSNSGVGFAVPISAIKRSIAQLEQKGEAEYAYIGVTTQPLYPQLARKLGLDTDYGGLLAEVVPGGPADKAGLRGGDGNLRFQAGTYETGGDVILSIEGHKIVTPDDLARAISLHEPGDKVTLEILRDGKHEEIQVTLGKRPRG
ncbi:MAG TPA: trypsin-like peptidase domain-containing protein [Solirubrobacterales bacterium]|jgi:S1-C subfamily serine protease|nr:trypsin-like peptidase domain-containing protein [Solirubrobacterales bacterium]